MYDEETQATSVSAIFSVNNPAGSSLCLSKPSFVTCNGESMHGKYDSELKQYVYSCQFDKKYIENILFEYVNNGGQSFKNDLSLHKLDISIDHLHISKSSGITYIPFLGKPLTDEETVDLHLDGGEEMITIMTQGSRLVISGEQFEDLSEGVYNGVFVRTLLSSDIKTMDRGGSISTQYKTKIIKISITA